MVHIIPLVGSNVSYVRSIKAGNQCLHTVSFCSRIDWWHQLTGKVAWCTKQYDIANSQRCKFGRGRTKRRPKQIRPDPQAFRDFELGFTQFQWGPCHCKRRILQWLKSVTFGEKNIGESCTNTSYGFHATRRAFATMAPHCTGHEHRECIAI